MPIKRSAYKELRKAKKRHYRNISIKSELRTLTKRFENLVSDKKLNEAKEFLKTLISAMDTAATKGIIHKNASSRRKSRLTKKLASSTKT